MSGYDKHDAAKDTGSSCKEVSQSWHQARDDAASEGSLQERNVNKVSDSSTGPVLYSIFNSVFGRNDDD